MQGLITGRHVVRHAFTIVRLWGIACWARCLRAAAEGRRTTFLGVVARDCRAPRRRD